MRLALPALLSVGCITYDEGGPGDGTDDTPRITLTDPAADDRRYGRSITATYEVANFTLDPSGLDGAADEEGQGHVHAYVDGVLVGETADSTYSFTELASGGHTLEVRLAENDHDEQWDGSWVYVETREASISIVNPPDGTQYAASSVPLQLTTTGFEVSPDTAFGEVKFGQGRYQVLVDGAVVDFGVDPAVTEVTQLGEGMHEVTVELVEADGVPLDPPARDTVNVEVLPAAPFIAIDRSPYLEQHASATVPLAIQAANIPLDYHLYVDGVFNGHATAESYTLGHVGPGYHFVELRVTDGGSELPIHDHLHLFVSPDRPDVAITYPGEGWGVPASFALTIAPENFTLDAANMGGANAPATGHWSVLVDGVQVAESATDTAALSGLVSGDRTLRVQLENNDHTPLDPPVYTEVHVTVE